MEQGREVFAIPGSIHNPLSRGCHALIRQGAKLVETAQDILEEIGPALADLNRVWKTDATDETLDSGVAGIEPSDLASEDQRRLYEQLGHEPTSVDILVERCGLTADAVSAMLVELELRGCVTSNNGMYSRT
jgi:DNA processing protein